MNDLSAICYANLVGLMLIPLAWWQFAHARDKRAFLALNVGTCLVVAASFALVGQQTAAAVSLAAATTSLGQYVLAERSPFLRAGVALASISGALTLAFPHDLFAWLAAFGYAWVRVAEASRESLMRTMYVLSPALWALLSLHAQSYTLATVDLVGLFLSIRWVVTRLERLERRLDTQAGEPHAPHPTRTKADAPAVPPTRRQTA
ncbi:hypothetical protein A9404_04025 [Halothiobacillus diazotrophicus]|uniref:YgjV family protein n=1 Tax=Halothiobacillus diazotrophicus TaxID=1860122 RepID=A0A191ZFM1_9GAMM|nr:YgjV family protein [Halothiobacillus diazotrophicus]ANJ66655.1 hypothetical protein A9404_04025 [Halothiobacillus diazotrophicus]